MYSFKIDIFHNVKQNTFHQISTSHPAIIYAAFYEPSKIDQRWIISGGDVFLNKIKLIMQSLQAPDCFLSRNKTINAC